MKKILVFICAITVAAHAQDFWQLRTSGVTNNLWSVAFAANQWVAVGEQGTILTSPDGSAWTPRTSGFPARWLVGVGFGTVNGASLWVVVGENGLILTSPDAITWTPRRTSGTRINAVAYGNGAFVAADDAGATYYSTDGITWNGAYYGSRNSFVRGLVYGAPHFVTTGLSGIGTNYDGISTTMRINAAPQMQGAAYGRHLYLVTGGANTYTSRDAINWAQQPATTAIGVQGATFFNNQFVAVGNGGGISTTFDGSAWTDRISGSTQTLTAVAAAPDSVIAVGFGGTILQSAPTLSVPNIVRSPSAVAEAVGGNVAFAVVARGADPLTYQWRKDGVALPGATSDSLFLSNAQLADAGNYSCAVANASGNAVSADAALTVLTTFAPADPVDATFTLGVSLSAAPRVAVAQLDGKILIGGNFLLLNQGVAQFGLARLNADGSLDTTFKPGSIDPNGSVNTIAVQPDGKILIGGSFISLNGVARRSLARLNTDGSLDSTFNTNLGGSPAATQIAVAPDGHFFGLFNTAAIARYNSDGSFDPTFGVIGINGSTEQRVDIQPDGKIVAAYTITNSGSPSAFIRRLNVDGSLDTNFPSYGLGSYSSILALRTLSDGRIAVVASNGVSTTVQRVTATGVIDPTFTAFSYGGSSGGVTSASISVDGRIWLAGSFNNLGGVSRSRLARLSSDGSLDLTYNAGSGPDVVPNFVTAFDDGRALVGGSFTRINTTSRAQLARLNAQSFGGANGPAVIALDSYYREVRAGDTLTVNVSATGSAQLTYSINSSSGSATGLTGPTVVFPPSTTQTSGAFSVMAVNSVSASIAQTLFVRVIPSAPVITAQPAALQTNSGRPITLAVTAVGTNSFSFTYLWFKNGSVITSATGSTYSIAKSTVNDTGDYTVVIRNSLGFTTSQTVHVGVDETARIVNLATRGTTTSSASPLIVGFVVQGLGTKRVMLRAVGPSLEQFSVPGFLIDPMLRVYNGSGVLIYTNDNWNQSNDVPGIASSPQRLGAFALNDGSKDAAGILTLTSGAYTAVITGAPVNGVETTGVALGEIYEDDIPQAPQSTRLVNLSSRGFVSPGASIMIPGFVTSTTSSAATKKFLIRGVGPALQQFGVTNVLLNPTLSVVDSTGKTVATNDDWEQNSNVDDLRAVTGKLAFPLAAGSKDAALLVSLASGQYTCLVSGVGDTSGTALVEIYEVP